MKFDIEQKITFNDSGGSYFSVRAGTYETDDKEEIRLLERSRYAKKIVNKKKKPKGTGSD